MNHPNLTLPGAQSRTYPDQNCSKVLHLCLLEQISYFFSKAGEVYIDPTEGNWYTLVIEATERNWFILVLEATEVNWYVLVFKDISIL